MSQNALIPYLFFSGRCEAAIEFYQSALGAELGMLMRFSDSPDPPPPGTLQPGFEDKVMHACIMIGEVPLMMSDGCDDQAAFTGFSLSLAFPNAELAHKAFDALAVEGTVTMPLGQTFWSSCFGMLTDRFGVSWMISVSEDSPQS